MANMNATDSDVWNFLFLELADPRTNDWLLIKSPVPIFSIVALYLYFVLFWGPHYMRDRKPFKLEKTLIVYNFIQIFVSAWLVYEGCVAWRYYNWRCQPVDRSSSPQAVREALCVYVYYLAKISELLDTVFFVLRKKERQITFLHVYHHSVMPLISWGTTKYYPGGHGTFIGWINSFVHIVMYTYYFLSAFGPNMQKYLWWKSHITTLQMVQFCMVFIHQTQLLYTDCGYPRWSVCFTLPNAIFFYYLFNDFYQKSYKKKQQAQADALSAKCAAAAAAAAASAVATARATDNNNDVSTKNLNGVPEIAMNNAQAKKNL